MEQWKRICPECKSEIYHTSERACRHSTKRGLLCIKCGGLRKRGKSNIGVGVANANRQWSKSSIEKMCVRYTGQGNPNFGGKYGFRGHKHTPEAIEKQKLARRKYWAKSKGVSIEHLHDGWSAWKVYRRRVDCLTRKQPLHLLENFDKRDRAGVDGAYHLDHIVSVYRGFRNNIPPEVIASMGNLQMLLWLENQRKWWH